jgi:hypothetical protein
VRGSSRYCNSPRSKQQARSGAISEAAREFCRISEALVITVLRCETARRASRVTAYTDRKLSALLLGRRLIKGSQLRQFSRSLQDHIHALLQLSLQVGNVDFVGYPVGVADTLDVAVLYHFIQAPEDSPTRDLETLRNGDCSHGRAHECSQNDINADGAIRCTIAMPRKISAVVESGQCTGGIGAFADAPTRAAGVAECHGAGENPRLRSSKRRSRFARCYEFDADQMPFDLPELRLRDLRGADRTSASFRKQSVRSVEVFALGFPKRFGARQPSGSTTDV